MAAGEPRGSNLGPWEESDLAATARSSVGLGADSGLPPDVRFLSAVAQLIKKRMASPTVDREPKRPAVFLLRPAPPETINASGRVPMLNNGLTPISGRLWFVSEVVVAGKYVDLDDLDDNAIFLMVTDTLSLGDVPAVVFDPRTAIPEVRFYPKGLADPEEYTPLRLGGTPVSIDQIFDAIDRIHQSCFVTPEAQVYPGNLWQSGDKHWVAANAEKLIQLSLKAGLVTAFPTCTVRHEQPGVSGRLDLELEENELTTPGKVIRHAILELKVLRSYGEKGSRYGEQATMDWVEGGVKQAAAYRTERNALAAALCCFDMRKTMTDQACFDHVLQLAQGLQVRLRAWYLFATSEAYRAATQANSQMN